MEERTQQFGLIVTERRSDDYMAYVLGDRARWDAGRTRVEAMGKLVMTWKDALWPELAQVPGTVALERLLLPTSEERNAVIRHYARLPGRGAAMLAVRYGGRTLADATVEEVSFYYRGPGRPATIPEEQLPAAREWAERGLELLRTWAREPSPAAEAIHRVELALKAAREALRPLMNLPDIHNDSLRSAATHGSYQYPALVDELLSAFWRALVERMQREMDRQAQEPLAPAK